MVELGGKVAGGNTFGDRVDEDLATLLVVVVVELTDVWVTFRRLDQSGDAS